MILNPRQPFVVTWIKNFVSGNLEGINLKCSLHHVSEESAMRHVFFLESTKTKSATDTATGSKWHATHIEYKSLG